MTATTSVSRPWLFGPKVDLIFGCGIGYALVTLALLVLAPPMDRLQGWLPFVILFTGLPHYGATLERVYSTSEARKRYGGYGFVFGLLVWGVFLATVISGRGGSPFVTLYLTWSPWHYAAQNFGLVMMFLRRAQMDVSNSFRLLVRASFVLSFLLVFVNIHRGSAANVNDPLYAAPAVRDAIRFVPLGIPEAWAKVALVCLGVTYAVVTMTLLVSMVRKNANGSRLPALSLVLSQSIWFVLPVILGQFVPAWVSPAGPTALAFIWVAIAHSVQYLWISFHFARMAGRTHLAWRSMVRYSVLTIFAGASLWVLPVLFSVHTGLSRMPHESGLDMLIAAAVNLHHFLLDGVIWKLRDAPVREALVDGRTASSDEKTNATRSYLMPFSLGLAGTIAVGSWILAAWEQEIGRRQAVSRGDFERLAIAEKRLALVGRDGPRIHQNLAKILQSRGSTAEALVEYRRSIESWPTANAWAGIGKIHETAGNIDDAIAAYESALALDPNHASVLDDLAHVLAMRGQWDEAIKMERRAVIAAPGRHDLVRRYDALVAKMPLNVDDSAPEFVVDVYDGGVDGSP